MNANEKYILEVAAHVRTWAEQHASRAIGYDFFQQPSLACMCAYASTVLMGCLQHFGVSDVELTGNEYHIFLTVNGKVLDITSTQFYLTEGIQGRRIEFDAIQAVRGRYKNGSRFWAVKFKRNGVESAFEYLNPYSPLGFPEDQYWKRKHEMKATIRQAVRHCEKHGVKSFSFEPVELAA